MAANDRWIVRDVLIALAGRRFSVDGNTVSLPFTKKAVMLAGFEDPADRWGKGPEGDVFSIDGTGTASETVALQRLADMTEPDEPIVFFTDGGVTAFAANSTAVFANAQIHTPTVGGGRGAAKAYKVSGHMVSRPWLGKVLYNNVNGAVINAAGTGTILNVGACGAGKLLGVCVQVVAPPGIGGTATPTITLRLESAALVGFGSPTTRKTFTAITTPSGQYFEIDGDVTPVSDAFWRLAWTAPGGTGPQFTVMAAIGLVTKT